MNIETYIPLIKFLIFIVIYEIFLILFSPIIDHSFTTLDQDKLLKETNSEILVDFVDASVSNGLDDNRTVYAKGVLKLIDSNYVFEAEIIKTSCPSKYED